MSLATFSACERDILELPEGKVQVGFALSSSASTKTEINSAADGFCWSLGDKVSVWAKSSDGSWALQNQVFNIYARAFDPKQAYFTSTLSSPMAAGTYSYYITYPVPESVSGTKATFILPSKQDGKASNGTDITISSAVSHKELSAIEESDPIEQSSDVVEASLHHILHFLKFYIPEGANFMGEPVRKIVFTMPGNVAGTVTVDITDPSTAVLSDGSKEIVLNLAEPLDASSESSRKYAVAGIFPTSAAYTSSDFMKVTMYSDNKMGVVEPIPLTGRSFAAGHVTPVRLTADSVKPFYSIRFFLASNNLGEEVQSLTMTLPDGICWPGTTSSSYTYSKEDGSEMLVGEEFTISTNDESAFRALSQKGVTVSFESEDAIVSESISVPDISSVSSTSVQLDVPYLFYEDFSGITADFHSNDEYSAWFVTGDKSGISFLDGWSGARVGGQAGTSIRITSRREVSARYAARCDSPFLTGLKHTTAEFSALGKSISLNVTFNYSMGREEGALYDAEVSQTMYFGYTNTTGNISSGTTTGTFDDGIEINETTGSFTNIDHDAERTLSGMGNDQRMSWRTYPAYNALGNSSCYLYLDNIKVKIQK